MITAIIYGSGGHAKVVIDALSIPLCKLRVVDDNPDVLGKLVLESEIYSPSDVRHLTDVPIHVAIGDCMSRRNVAQKLLTQGYSLLTVKHETSILSAHSLVSTGAFLAARSIVAPCCKIGLGFIANHGAVIDHDSTIEDWVHIAPNATVGGGVSIGDNVLVGSAASILPGIKIASNTVIGSGAVVTKDITESCTVTGIPARPA